jgi:signal transduction histidine kinase
MPTSAVPRMRTREDTRTADRFPHDAVTPLAWAFSRRLRTAPLVWLAVSLPVVALAAGAADDTQAYLLVFAVVASGLYTTPAFLNTWLAARRSPAPDNRCWWLWLSALVLMYAIGVAMVAGAVVDVRVPTAVGAVFVVGIAVLLMTSIVMMVRARSGGRATSIDLIESFMSVIVVSAPAALVFGERIVEAEAHWYALPASLAVPCMVFGVYWTVLLVTRLQGTARRIAIPGLALTVLGLGNAVVQTAQGVTGFALPSGPVLVLHAATMSVLSFTPLYVPGTISPGLDRLPPQGQVRASWIPAALMLAGIPLLFVTTLALRDRYAWAPVYSLVVMAVLLVLAALRQLAGTRETRRLYGEVERAAATRRDLLAQVMQRSDDDRHRVAAQLHEQAVATYATFVSFIQISALVPTAASSGPVAEASALVRDELGKQAESLRQLMLAVQPLGPDRPERARCRARGLTAPIEAYVDGLYGDRRGPCLTVNVEDDLVLDWPTETLVLRIVQESVSNVWRHADASQLIVTLRSVGAVVEVKVADDGAGFDPSAALFESGIEVMRSCTALAGGALTIDSAPGHGTRVIARLGADEDDRPDATVVRLRPVGNRMARAASVDEA